MKTLNNIQVFGLQRSGTNFLEWSLINNFIDINYKIYSFKDSPLKGNIKGMARYQKPQSVKHLTPTLDYSDYSIGIYKSYDKWLNSALKSGHLINKDKSEEIYNEWLKEFNRLDNTKTILINHDEMVNEYEKVLKEISSKFNLRLVNNITRPEKKLNRNATLSNKDYKYE